MTKTTIFSIIGVAAVIIVVILVVVLGDKSSSKVTSDTQQDTQVPSGKKMAFSQFIKQGGSYQCTVNQYIDAGMTQTTEGSVFISGEKIRGDFATKAQGMDIKSSMIVRDGFAYTWTSMMATGFKIPITETEAKDTTAGAQAVYGWNAEQIGDYDCQPWVVDASKFAVPTTITFQTI